MEMQLNSLGEPMARGISPVASPAVLGTSVRTRSMSGAGVYHVPAFRGLDSEVGDFGCPVAIPTQLDQMAQLNQMAQLDQTDPQIFTYKFTTRQGPPTCSPPV
jgi:hypothetical protein